MVSVKLPCLESLKLLVHLTRRGAEDRGKPMCVLPWQAVVEVVSWTLMLLESLVSAWLMKIGGGSAKKGREKENRSWHEGGGRLPRPQVVRQTECTTRHF